MVDVNTLDVDIEMPFATCSCGKILGDKYYRHKLITKTMGEIFPKYQNDENPDRFNQEWRQRREEQKEIITDNMKKWFEIFGIEYNLETWKTLKMISEEYKTATNRENKRLDLTQEAKSSLIYEKAQEIGIQPADVDPDSKNFDKIVESISDREIISEIIRSGARYISVKNLNFKKLSLTQQLERVGYPLQSKDPKWLDNFKEKINPNLSENKIIELIKKFLKRPSFILLAPLMRLKRQSGNSIPVPFIDQTKWTRLQRKNQTAIEEGIPMSYNDISMEYLGLERMCCRMFFGQPIILPEETKLNVNEYKQIGYQHPDLVILDSKFVRGKGDMPTQNALNKFSSGNKMTNIRLHQLTKRNLAKRESTCINVDDIIKMINFEKGEKEEEDDNLEIEDNKSVGNNIQLFYGSEENPYTKYEEEEDVDDFDIVAFDDSEIDFEPNIIDVNFTSTISDKVTKTAEYQIQPSGRDNPRYYNKCECERLRSSQYLAV